MAHQDAVEPQLPGLVALAGVDILATDDLSLLDDLNTFQDLPQFTGLGWRIEVTDRGRYWNWRRGSGSNRDGRYGGVFATLSEERQAAYERNKRKYARRAGATKTKGKSKAKAQQGRRAGDPADSARRVPTRRDHRGTSPEQSGITPTA